MGNLIPQAGRDTIEAVKLIRDFVVAVDQIAAILNEPRSVILEVHNFTDVTLNRRSDNHAHGGFASPPSGQIPPQTSELFGSQSKAWSVATGTEGSVTYEGDGFELKIWWDNPFFGGNSCSATLSGPRADSFDVVATPGAGNEKAEMLYELRTFAARHLRAARFVGDLFPTALTPGEMTEASVTMRNIGGATWDATEAYRLGSQNPQDNDTWGLQRVDVGEAVKTGEEHTFRFTVTAPSRAGEYGFQWRMVQEGVEWFGDYTPNHRVRVSVNSPECGSLKARYQELTEQFDAVDALDTTGLEGEEWRKPLPAPLRRRHQQLQREMEAVSEEGLNIGCVVWE